MAKLAPKKHFPHPNNSIQLAKMVGDIATGQLLDEQSRTSTGQHTSANHLPTKVRILLTPAVSKTPDYTVFERKLSLYSHRIMSAALSAAQELGPERVVNASGNFLVIKISSDPMAITRLVAYISLVLDGRIQRI